MCIIPATYKSHIIEFHGHQGIQWLEQLPTRLAQCAERWQLTLGQPFTPLSYHYVIAATRADGTPVVIKAIAPTNEFPQEVAALRHFDGQGMVQLLAVDESNQVMLLERLTPGTLLTTMADDEQATRIAAGIMRQLWRPVPEHHSFPAIQDWQRGYTRLRMHYPDHYGPFPKQLLDRAESLYTELSASMEHTVLLHGDLHHYNILAATRSPWLAIDPKGLIGEPAYETGAFLRNPFPQLLQQPDPRRLLERRIAIFADELDISRERIRDWAIAQAVLSAWWDVESSGNLNTAMLACAKILASIP